MSKKFCQCGRKIVVLRRITHTGRHYGQIKVYSDSKHSLCDGCSRRLFQSLMQSQKFAAKPEPPPVPVLSFGQRRRLAQLYADY